MLKDSVVIQAMGDYDEPCHVPTKDIVVPAYVAHYELNEFPLVKSSERETLVRAPPLLASPPSNQQATPPLMEEVYFCPLG